MDRNNHNNNNNYNYNNYNNYNILRNDINSSGNYKVFEISSGVAEQATTQAAAAAARTTAVSRASPSEKDFSTIHDEKLFTKIQRYQFIDRMLNANFPMAFALLLALLDFFTGAVLIGLQILCVIYRTPLFYVAVGLELFA